MSIHSLTAEQRFEAGHLGRMWWALMGAVAVHLALVLTLPHPHFRPYELSEPDDPIIVDDFAGFVLPPPPEEVRKEEAVAPIAPSDEADPGATIAQTVIDLREPYVPPAAHVREPFTNIFDTPPVVVKQVYPVYPELARQAELEGVVMLKVGIDESGQVKEALVVRSVPGLDEAALDAVRQWRFTPGKQRDVPVPVWIVVPIRFSLNG